MIEPQLHRLTAREYLQLDIVGRTELIGGLIYDMAARKDPHRWAVNYLSKHLQLALPQLQVQVQDAVAIPNWDGLNAPEPDIAITTNPKNPTAADTQAIIEVSDTTYTWDRKKVGLYTMASVNSWIVNIQESRVEFYPASQQLYALPQTTSYFYEGETFFILGVDIAVSALFETKE